MFSESILYETHMHTPLCKHAKGEPEEYAAVAEQRGLKGIIVTCHNPTNNGWAPQVRMSFDQFDDYVAMVERARQSWAGRVDVRLGMESDYAPGMEPWLEKLHGLADFHHILGSVHAPLPDYKDRYLNGDIVAFQRLYFEHLAMAAETGLFDTLAHPDLVKNVAPAEWRLDRLLDDIRRALDRIAATGVAMELNTSGLNKAIREMNPGQTILAEMQQRHIPVVVGADAHEPGRVAANFEDALDLLEAVGYRHINIFLNRHRHEIEIEAARQSLLTERVLA
jgi:histidinol-phosphatase (PHP family)